MVTYKQAGVDIELANKFIKSIKKISRFIGGFSGLYPLQGSNKYLAGCCDGVGTKLKIASLLNKHDTVGIDLVAMNVNDLICCGAKPLFFLDYYACSKLDINVARQVIKGIVRGCKMADCILLGGETAELPGMYNTGEYDLAGFAVGIVEKDKVIDGSNITPGDVLIGLPSSGLHSNGFSMVRKIFSQEEIKKYATMLLAPTRIYVKEILSTINYEHNYFIKGIAHITGGGFYDNIVRILPEGCQAVIDANSWVVPDIFNLIMKKGTVNKKEMYKVFNMGIGMILIVNKLESEKVRKLLDEAIIIGEIKKGKRKIEIKW